MKVILDWLTRPFTYWYHFLMEMRLWLIFQHTAKKSRDKLQEQDLRVDWIGRVYGVVNIPDEVLGAAEEVQQAYVLKQLGQYGSVMRELNLADIVYPMIEPIPGTGAYLVIFWPVLDRLNLLNILGHFLYSSAYFFLVYLLIRFLIVYNIVGDLFSFIANLL